MKTLKPEIKELINTYNKIIDELVQNELSNLGYSEKLKKNFYKGFSFTGSNLIYILENFTLNYLNMVNSVKHFIFKRIRDLDVNGYSIEKIKPIIDNHLIQLKEDIKNKLVQEIRTIFKS
jgi:hypothetical protein